MKKGNIPKFKLDPKKPPRSDWRAFDAMSAAEPTAPRRPTHCPPASKAQLARARRVPTVAALRKKLKLTQEEFARHFISRSAPCATGSKARTSPTRRQRSCSPSLPTNRECGSARPRTRA